MDEAEYLADRIIVLAGGEIVAEGTPGTLGARERSAARITFTLPSQVVPAQLPVFPVRHLAQAELRAFDPLAAAPGIAWGHLLVVAAWGVAGLLVAVRFFRWSPR